MALDIAKAGRIGAYRLSATRTGWGGAVDIPPTSFKWFWDSLDEEIVFMKKNIASQVIGRQMITIADGSNFTGSVTVDVTIDGGTQSAGGGTVTHEGKGYHTYTPTQAETNGDHVAFTFSGSGALTRTIDVYTNFPQSTDNDVKISNIPNTTEFNARTILSANYATAANLAIVDSNVDAILADTNELQSNQGDWLTATGFSTFNPATDTVATVTTVTNMRGTDNALLASSYTAPDNAGIAANGVAIADVPTVAEFNARTLPSASYSQFDYTTNEVSANITKINGVTITGNGSTNPFDV